MEWKHSQYMIMIRGDDLLKHFDSQVWISDFLSSWDGLLQTRETEGRGGGLTHFVSRMFCGLYSVYTELICLPQCTQRKRCGSRFDISSDALLQGEGWMEDVDTELRGEIDLVIRPSIHPSIEL